MSKKRNGVFSAVVPVLGTAQITAPIQLRSDTLVRHSQNSKPSEPTVRYSTGSTLLDSFVQANNDDTSALQPVWTVPSNDKTATPPNNSLRKPLDASPKSAAVKPASAKLASTKPAGVKPASPKLASAKPKKYPPQRQPKLRQNAPTSSPQDVVKARQRALAKMRQKAQRRAQESLPRLNQPTQQPTNLSQTGLANKHHHPKEPQQKNERPVQPNAVQSTAARVYGGADYTAMQSRAQAGGLVNLEDSLLFGGTEKRAIYTGKKSDSSAFSADLSSWLGELLRELLLEDFTPLPSSPSGWHPTAYLETSEETFGKTSEQTDTARSQAARSQAAKFQTVLSIDSFKLSDLETISSTREAVDLGAETQQGQHRWTVSGANLQIGNSDNDSDSEHAALAALSKQVIYLNQKIEFLSKQLAVMTTANPSAASPQRHSSIIQSSVVLNLESVDLNADEKATEPRLATLASLDEGLTPQKL